jgi:uncharacterized 2Fe-2S/4Fe-4S cluster protein (DUF4445 family)
MGVSPRNIAASPFIPAFTHALEAKAYELGLCICPMASIHTLPNLASYVGADIVGSVMASGMDRRDELTLLVDIGTNGEIVLGNQKAMLACSTAAGPALEGAHIRYGMGGVAGAISKVENRDGQVYYETIGDQSAVGLCGSGIVDAVALLLEAEIVDETGRMDPDNAPDDWQDRFTYEGRNCIFALTKPDARTNAVSISQKDIREVQLAKGAIAAGIEVLIRQWGAAMEDIQRVCLAGGFGNYINRHNGCRIGLLPQQLESKIEGIGNGAGAGARMALLSPLEEAHARQVREKMHYIELSAIKEFQDLFMDKMIF